jgi:hypothetical protein
MPVKTEIHQEGTAQELSLSRKLIRALEDFGGNLPPQVDHQLSELKKFYKRQLEAETL